jgi:ABC-type Fe3+ transport system permease subunit
LSKRVYQDTPACRAAVIQALRFHFHLRVKEIATVMQLPSQTISTLTGSNTTVFQWYERGYQQEAIAAARDLLYKRI